jgi:hypothetical protein
VVGKFEARVWDREAGQHEPQRVDMLCETCGATFQVMCEQGRPRGHVDNFAHAHAHPEVHGDVWKKR